MSTGESTERPGAKIETATGGAWDQRFARWLVRPLVSTPIMPNHITTLRLVVGLCACAGFAVGEREWANWGAGLFILSNLIDHADGELARLTGKSTWFGHKYDITCDALVHTLLFVAIGIGLGDSAIGEWSLELGILAGLSISLLFWIFGHREKQFGREGVQPQWAGFELEDVLYLVAPVVWLGWQMPLLLSAAAIAPIVALGMIWHHRRTLFPRAGEGS